MVARWFAKHHTHPVLQRFLMLAIHAWISEQHTLRKDMGIPPDLEEWGIQDPLEEQQCTGWSNFLTDRITSKFGIIQMQAYHNDDTIKSIPAHYSGTWWTAISIKEMIYMSLNLWQQRNRYLHDTEASQQELHDRRSTLQKVAEWYDLKHQLLATDQVHFYRSYTGDVPIRPNRSPLVTKNILLVQVRNARCRNFFSINSTL